MNEKIFVFFQRVGGEERGGREGRERGRRRHLDILDGCCLVQVDRSLVLTWVSNLQHATSAGTQDTDFANYIFFGSSGQRRWKLRPSRVISQREARFEPGMTARSATSECGTSTRAPPHSQHRLPERSMKTNTRASDQLRHPVKKGCKWSVTSSQMMKKRQNNQGRVNQPHNRSTRQPNTSFNHLTKGCKTSGLRLVGDAGTLRRT